MVIFIIKNKIYDILQKSYFIFEKNLLCVNEFLSPYVIFSLLILEKI